MKCPKCGYKFKAANQVKGGKARWSGMTKSQRKQAASAAAKARWAKSANKEIAIMDAKAADTTDPKREKHAMRARNFRHEKRLL